MRVTDKQTAVSVGAKSVSEAIFLDSDGDEIHRGTFSDGSTLDQTMSGAAKKYSSREVAWSSVDWAKPAASEKPYLILVADERKDSEEALKALEDRTVVKYHERFVCVRIRRDSEEAKKWGVSQAPSMVVLDPAKREPVEKLTGRKPAKDVKAFLTKALAKLEGRK